MSNNKQKNFIFLIKMEHKKIDQAKSKANHNLTQNQFTKHRNSLIHKQYQKRTAVLNEIDFKKAYEALKKANKASVNAAISFEAKKGK